MLSYSLFNHVGDGGIAYYDIFSWYRKSIADKLWTRYKQTLRSKFASIEFSRETMDYDGSKSTKLSKRMKLCEMYASRLMTTGIEISNIYDFYLDAVKTADELCVHMNANGGANDGIPYYASNTIHPKKGCNQDNSAVSSQVVTTTETPTSSEDISTEVASVEVSDASGYLKDLEGESLTSTYDVVDKEYYKDFVNYELKRASVDDGMEMYWLEITYENKNYRCQIPYYAAATMDISGICVVEIEKLKLASGGSVISYMQVIYDYDKMLQE